MLTRVLAAGLVVLTVGCGSDAVSRKQKELVQIVWDSRSRVNQAEICAGVQTYGATYVAGLSNLSDSGKRLTAELLNKVCG